MKEGRKNGRKSQGVGLGGEEILQNWSTYLAQEKAGKKGVQLGLQGMFCQPKRASKSSEERVTEVQMPRGEGLGSGQ